MVTKIRLVVALGFVAILVIAFGMHIATTERPTIHTTLPVRDVLVGSTTVRAEIASTDFERQQGLSGRQALGDGTGMLFVFEREGDWGIWMKDMNFPLDIIWADSSGTVVTIARDVAPETYPDAFYPTGEARYVLEVPAGFAAAHGVVEGANIVVQ